MFDRRLSEDVEATREIIDVAVARSRVPGRSQSRGNASGSADAVLTGTSGQASGTTADGAAYFVCLTDVDSTNSGAVTG